MFNVDYFTMPTMVAVITMLLTKSKLFSSIRDWFPEWVPVHCPVCICFWIASPCLYYGVPPYFTIIAIANLWMFAIAKLYLAVEEMDYDG